MVIMYQNSVKKFFIYVGVHCTVCDRAILNAI